MMAATGLQQEQRLRDAAISGFPKPSAAEWLTGRMGPVRPALVIASTGQQPTSYQAAVFVTAKKGVVDSAEASSGECRRSVSAYPSIYLVSLKIQI